MILMVMKNIYHHNLNTHHHLCGCLVLIRILMVHIIMHVLMLLMYLIILLMYRMDMNIILMLMKLILC